MAAFDVLHARNDARQDQLSSFDRLHQYTMDTDLECRQKLLEQSPRIQIQARRVLLPPILSWDRSFDNTGRGAFEIPSNEMLRSFRYIRFRRSAREIEFLRTPLRR